jgi:hypothetical protein
MKNLILRSHFYARQKSVYLEDQQDAVLRSLYLSYCQVTLHVSRTHHQEYTAVVTTTGTEATSIWTWPN